MMQPFCYIHKNGNDKLIATGYIDMSKPKVWVEGHCYKFNRTYLRIEVVYKERSK